MYVFIHIQKSVGSAVRNALRRFLGTRNILHAGIPSETVALSAKSFSLMRKPDARTISLWRHLACAPDQRGYPPAKFGLSPWVDIMQGNAYERLVASPLYLQQQKDGFIPDFPIGDQTEPVAFRRSVLGPEAADIWQLNTVEGDFELSVEERVRSTVISSSGMKSGVAPMRALRRGQTRADPAPDSKGDAV